MGTFCLDRCLLGCAGRPAYMWVGVEIRGRFVPQRKYKLRHKCQMDTIAQLARDFNRFKWHALLGVLSGWQKYFVLRLWDESRH